MFRDYIDYMYVNILCRSKFNFSLMTAIRTVGEILEIGYFIQMDNFMENKVIFDKLSGTVTIPGTKIKVTGFKFINV